MTDCPFELDNDRWTCRQCGWIYPRPSAKPPRRNCPQSPQGEAGRIASLEQAAGEQHNAHYPQRSDDDLTHLITVCLDCEHFADRCNGNLFPEGCSGRRQWLKALSSVGFRECPMWRDGQP